MVGVGERAAANIAAIGFGGLPDGGAQFGESLDELGPHVVEHAEHVGAHEHLAIALRSCADAE